MVAQLGLANLAAVRTRIVRQTRNDAGLDDGWHPGFLDPGTTALVRRSAAAGEHQYGEHSVVTSEVLVAEASFTGQKGLSWHVEHADKTGSPLERIGNSVLAGSGDDNDIKLVVVLVDRRSKGTLAGVLDLGHAGFP